MRIMLVAAARPNLPKVWAVYQALGVHPVERCFVHAGQHYDDELHATLLADLGLPPPDVQLQSGSGSPATQTAAVLPAFEQVVTDLRPDAVVVVGDVNATLSCALVAARSPALLVHVEAGLRSRDRSMPEELNRVATDHLSDLLLAPSVDAVANLQGEGLGPRTTMVGNTMVDALDAHLEAARARAHPVASLAHQRHGLVTLHRPSNVDDDAVLGHLVEQLGELAQQLPVLLPAHPRTHARLAAHRLPPGIVVVPPLGYLDLLRVLDAAAVVVTDSGGIQEEATVLGVPCLTVRTTTERPVTIDQGTNRLVDPSDPHLARHAAVAARDAVRRPARPEGWDGRAGERSAAAIVHAVRAVPEPTGRVLPVVGTATQDAAR
jgi:UDP-N-acetylglucosamine 2-epimerase (non-hydrolysing)